VDDEPFNDVNQTRPQAERHMMSGPISLLELLHPTVRLQSVKPHDDPTAPEEPPLHHPLEVQSVGTPRERVSQAIENAFSILAEED
jgi:hypothetical protein